MNSFVVALVLAVAVSAASAGNVVGGLGLVGSPLIAPRIVSPLGLGLNAGLVSPYGLGVGSYGLGVGSYGLGAGLVGYNGLGLSRGIVGVNTLGVAPLGLGYGYGGLGGVRLAKGGLIL